VFYVSIKTAFVCCPSGSFFSFSASPFSPVHLIIFFKRKENYQEKEKKTE